jgi:hypothetical protein
MLQVLTNDDECLRALVLFTTDLVEGKMPDVLKPYLLSTKLNAHLKDPDSDKIRPIAVGEALFRMGATHVMHANRANLREYFGELQLGHGFSWCL